MDRRTSQVQALGAALLMACVSGTVAAQTFSNSNLILVKSSGPAEPYPSQIVVSGVGTSLTGLTVTLRSVGHTFPADLDIALVGPTGAAIVLQSDCGGSAAMGKVTYTFSDSGMTLPPAAGGIAAGSYRPGDCEPGKEFAALQAGPPVSTGGVATLGKVYGGTNPNGTWNLFVVDDSSGDSGIIQDGWSITIESTPVELQKFTIE